MALFSLTERSIFFKIYTGLLIICAMVAFFAYFFIVSINEARLQAYHEDISSSMFHLVGEGIIRHSDKTSRNLWLQQISTLFGDQFVILSFGDTLFKSKEIKRLNDGLSVVRHDSKKKQFRVFQKISDDEVLAVQISQIGDRQARAMAVLLLDDLSHYTTISAKRNRLQVLSQKFDYPIVLDDTKRLRLDSSQLARLKLDDTLILFENNNSEFGLSVKLIIQSNLDGMAIVAGPVPLFNWFPVNLLISTALISVFLISLGVYAMIFPLERRLNLLQIGVDSVSKGDLTTKVQVVGQDDIARLSSTFNLMTEHIKRLIESQRELTRAVSHELRTPVARIRFAVDMLADDDDYESRQSQKAYIDDDIESLNDLIDEILTYAKLEEGSPQMAWEMVNLSELVAQIVRETNALGKPITVIANPPNAKITAMADRRYLHRVLQNLAGNATRYAKSQVIISAGVKNKRAFVTVEDDGQGIAEKDRQKVFVPFARLDDSRTRASGGYGLGLSIVSRIAFWFYGQMQVDESPSLKGARFTMQWPVKQAGVQVAPTYKKQANQ